jgi:hypothetical protein
VEAEKEKARKEIEALTKRMTELRAEGGPAGVREPRLGLALQAEVPGSRCAEVRAPR